MPETSKFLKIFLPLVLASIAIFLCFRNYTPGTYLIGWDSMHPEFNFSLNASRMLSHVWGSEMGVGAISAHSDMSDMPRVLILWLASLAIPASFIRYFYIFSCLIIGPLGVYFFLKYVLEKEKDSPWIYPAAFLGGLFYLLNLGTVQNFYVPLEMFTVAFAGLPWFTFFGFKFLREGRKKNILLFSLASIFISPMAYAATQAYAIYFGLFLFFLSFAFFSSSKKLKLRRLLILGSVTLVLNVYWVLPNVYSVVQQSLTISNANINRLFSQESFLRNADYGNLANVAVQKSFLFSWRNFDFQNGEFKDLMGAWNNHLETPAISTLGYVLAFISVLGLIAALIKREKVGLSFILPLLLCAFFLFNINPPFGQIYQYLYSHFGVFREGFRTPFTKFSVLFEFILAFYFGYFWFKVLALRDSPLKVIRVITVFGETLLTVIASGALIYFSLPAFSGELVGKNVRVAFPTEYGELFDWFAEHSEGRVALMPESSKYGWEYRNWGYEGSGFLTYGIKNPIFYRDFDRWNSANEDFYNQSAFALYADDDQTFVNTLEKYQVKYLLLDESITNAGASDDVLRIPQIKEIAEKYKMAKAAEFGFLTVYDTGFGKDQILAPESYSKVAADLSYSLLDPIYKEFGDYLEGEKVYPFINLDKRSGVQINIKNEAIEFKNTKFDATISLPATDSAKADLSINQGFENAYNCDLKKIGGVSKEITDFGVLYKATGGAANCDYVSFPDLKYSQAYILHITGENYQGRGLKIYLFDSLTQLPYVEEILPGCKFDETYFIYPRNLSGSGYTLNFETRSFGRIPSENFLTGVEFYPVDYAYLQGASLQGAYSILQGDIWQNNLQIQNVKKYGTWGYRVGTTGTGILELGQGYDKGWVAFQLPINNLQFTILDHTKINSWANGWFVPSPINNQDSTIYIFYWPQALEWGGMIFGGIALVVLVLLRGGDRKVVS